LSRAAKLGLPTTELAVGYRKRIGISRISSTIAGVFSEGNKILFIIAREAFGDFGKSNRAATADEQAGNRSIDRCVA
jgi:hypothetical protein